MPKIITDENMVVELVKGGVFYMARGTEPCKCHIVEMIECDMVVFKWYSKHKQRWVYEVKNSFMVNSMHDLYLGRKEHRDLQAKSMALTQFIIAPKFNELPEVEQADLKKTTNAHDRLPKGLS